MADKENSAAHSAGQELDEVRAERARDRFEQALREAQEARRRLEDFARATSDWFWETDAEDRLVYLSERITAICGVPTATLLGKRLDEIGTFPPAAGGESVMNRAHERRQPFRDQLFQLTDSAGETLTFHIAGVPVFDPVTGDYTGYRGSGVDMTARYRAERESREARHSLEKALEDLTNKNVEADLATAQAEAALRDKSNFITSLSHELRTPLNAIIGFADSMSMEVFGKLNDRYKQYSQDIVGAARHLLDLINDILDEAAVESGKIQFHTEPVDVAEMLRDALALIRMRAENKKITVEAPEVDPSVQVNVDSKRARQILVNLLSNAVKFTPEEGRIGIDVAVGTPEDNLVAITVWDTGIGIPAKQHATVFERFEQVTEDAYARQQEGSGLGLSISRELARMMGGDITVDSEFGKGSRFTVTLPKAES